jgi:hypothetical protein
MNRTGSLVTGVAVAAMLGVGLTATVPAVGLRTVSADDQELQDSVGSEFFRVDWTAKPDGHGNVKISGYVYNKYGEAADQLQLRIIALDPSGKQIGSFLEPVPDTVSALDRQYFDVKVPVQATSYRVAVESFNFLEEGGF